MSAILVVDDNPTNRKLVAVMLRYEGHEVFEAADGAEGLACARLHSPQLVISDILMPTMDGYEFVRQLRADPSLAQTAVIFYTANYHEREAQALAIMCQVDRVITKPCGRAEFLDAVSAVLETADSRRGQISEEGFDAEHKRLLTDKVARIAADLQASNQQLAAMIDLNVQLASERDTKVLLDKVCAGARRLLAAKYAVLAVTDKRTPGSAVVATSGLEFPAPVPSPEVLAEPLGALVRSARPLRLSDSKTALDLGLPEAYPKAHTALAVSVSSLTRTYGWLCLADKLGGGDFTAEDERLLSILGAQVGRIYENGSLYAEAQAYATELLVEIGERERAVTELLASEERFRQVAETIQDVFFIVSADLRDLFYVSPAYERIWGYPATQLASDPRAWAQAIVPGDRDEVLRTSEQIVRRFPQPGRLEFRIRRRDGELRWISARLFPVCDGAVSVTRVVGIATDITERHLAEEKVRQLNRVHRVLSGINSLIVRADDRDALLQEACRIAVESGNFGMACCGLVEEPDRLRITAMSGQLELNSDQLEIDLGDSAERGNPLALAIATREAVILNDLAALLASPNTFGAALHKDGYQALVVLPLIVGGEAIGCLALAATEAGVFDADEMRLLDELAGDIAYAMDHIAKAERLNYLAYFDVLTGLPNRALFQDRLAQLIKVAGHSAFAVLVVDPERFAAFNDTIGRAAADRLLGEMALRFARSVGASDLVGRLGSDQLGAVVTDVQSIGDVSRFIEDLGQKWLGTPFIVHDQPVSVSAKVGVSMYPTDAKDAETLLRHAETALSTAKASGRPYAAYTTRLSEELAQRLTLEKHLQRALEKEEFVLYYQPKVDLDQRRVQGVEALMRWNSPQLGLVSPGQFIPLAEQNGLIVQLGAWALRQALQHRTRWLELQIDAPRIAVNVSAVQLRRDDFLRMVTNVVRLGGKEHGLDIEVTESVLMDDVSDNLAKLKSVRDLGLSIALDDFGTGFSSLSYLARLPVHTLKIDRSFVSTMLDDPSAMTLVSTIISLARALKLETVAEGVELEEQAKILRLLHCDHMQGYLVSRPLPFDEMTTFLARSKR